MQAKCPKCGKEPSQGTDHAVLLEHAAAGKVRFYCSYCDATWTPRPAEQKLYANQLRDLLADS
jgi:hypothetical protein